jgi:hypothetical protein
MPLCCFILIAVYAFSWARLSHEQGLRELGSTGGH